MMGKWLVTKTSNLCITLLQSTGLQIHCHLITWITCIIIILFVVIGLCISLTLKQYLRTYMLQLECWSNTMHKTFPSKRVSSLLVQNHWGSPWELCLFVVCLGGDPVRCPQGAVASPSLGKSATLWKSIYFIGIKMKHQVYESEEIHREKVWFWLEPQVGKKYYWMELILKES